MMGLLIQCPGISHADPAVGDGHSKDDDQLYIAQVTSVIEGVATLGSAASVRGHRNTVNALEEAYKKDLVPYGEVRSGSIPGTGALDRTAYRTLIDQDQKLSQLKREIEYLYGEYRWLEDFYKLKNFPRGSAVYKEGYRLRDKAEELSRAYDLRLNTIWSYYKDGGKFYKGNMLTAEEIGKIMTLREKERLAWRKVMREAIRKEKKNLVAQTLTSALGLFSTSYSFLKGAEASQRMEKAKAEAHVGSNGTAQAQVSGAAAAAR